MLKELIREALLVSPWVFDQVNAVKRNLLGEREEIRFLKSLDRVSHGVRVIQVGANDGIRNDPVRSLILEKRMSAVFVEPDPVAFEELQRAYRPYDSVIPLAFVNCAVVPESGEDLSYYTLSRSARSVLSKRQQIRLSRKASFNKERFEGYLRQEGFDEVSRLVAETTIEGTGINEFLDRWGAPDLLVTDAEGLDWDLIGNLDLERFQPGVLVFEIGNPVPEKRATVLEKLADHGYRVKIFPHDIIAYRE